MSTGYELSCSNHLAKVGPWVGTASAAAVGQASEKGELIRRGQGWPFQDPEASCKRKSCKVMWMIFVSYRRRLPSSLCVQVT